MLLVRKSDQKPLAMETWSHNRFYQFQAGTLPEVSPGMALIDGELLLENGVSPLIYISHGGHGVRAAKPGDGQRLDQGLARIYRPAAHAESPALVPATPWVRHYDLRSMDLLHRHALDPRSKLISHQVPVAPGLLINVFVHGDYSGGDNWARPKMPWGWFEQIMDSGVPLGAWYLHPAWVFARNFALKLDQSYLSHRALEAWRVGDIEGTLAKVVRNSGLQLSANIRPYAAILIDQLKQAARGQIDYWFKALE